MAQSQRLAGAKVPESEKITINLGHVDLGYIDLLVAEGVYANRSDFIRTAIRSQIGRHADITKQSVARRSVELGLCRIDRADLEAARAEGRMLHVRVLGLATIGPDVTPELARETIGTLCVLGSLQASPAVREALSDRLR